MPRKDHSMAMAETPRWKGLRMKIATAPSFAGTGCTPILFNLCIATSMLQRRNVYCDILLDFWLLQFSCSSAESADGP